MLLFGAKSKARLVDGGRVEERHCAECGRATVFRECDVTDRFDVFFVELGQSTQRRLVCSECGEDIALDEAPARVAPAATTKPVLPATPAKRALSERDKDRLLEELKQRMKKS
jgi:hypothetical protein